MRDGTQSERFIAEGQSKRDIRQVQLIAFMAVSLGCVAAAIATGTYAFWLSRRQLADEALLSVHDLLETCRDRVSRMEAELNILAAATPGELPA